MLYLEELVKEEEIKLKASRRKEIIKKKMAQINRKQKNNRANR